MRSHLLAGKVRHRRATPFVYELEHDVFYAALDLSELDEVSRRVRLIRRNRPGIVTFRDADHLPRPARDLDADVRAHLRSEGHAPADWQITLVTNLRVLGYVFNPASFYLCRDVDGALRVVIVEVHNTFGERHLYTLEPARDSRVVDAGVAGAASGADRTPGAADAARAVAGAAGATSAAPATPFAAGMPKAFFVSPFISMDGRYAVHVRDDEAGLRIAIVLRQDGEVALSTSLVLQRRPLTDGSLLRLLLRHPLLTHRTIGLIHWHALRLWRRGATFHRHGAWRADHGGAVDGRPAEAPGR